MRPAKEGEEVATNGECLAGVLFLAAAGFALGWVVHEKVVSASRTRDLRERVEIVEIERTACHGASVADVDHERCDEIARIRIEGEASLVLEGIERTLPEPRAAPEATAPLEGRRPASASPGASL
jgi:hypothetical protein